MPTRRAKLTYCCNRFGECVEEGSIHYCGKDDETEWAVQGFYHLYYCPFCGASVKGTGWGDYQEKDPPKNRRQPNKPYLDSSRKTSSMMCATTGSDCSRISGLSRERSRSGP